MAIPRTSLEVLKSALLKSQTPPSKQNANDRIAATRADVFMVLLVFGGLVQCALGAYGAHHWRRASEVRYEN
jgi:hypothetical protein